VIPVERALEIVLASTPRLPTENVDFRRSLGRVLAEDVIADSDLPPFPRSAVDGFALRAADVKRTPARLRVLGVVAAGTSPAFAIGPGEAAHVMTGAPVPDGADAVSMVEQTRELAPDRVEILQSVEAGQNVAPRAHEVAKGETVLLSGTRIDPAALAVLATVGKTEARVARVPRVAIVATGNELVPPWETPGPGRIRNSNGFSLAAQCVLAGAEADYLGVAGDDLDSIRKLAEDGLTRDVLLFSGGVSMGLFDLVEEVLQKLNVRILVDAVALKPGKPLVFGTAPEGKLVFGLPGNPVSTMVTFELFVRPALARLQGADEPSRSTLSAVLTGSLSSKGPRRAYLPGWVSPNAVGALEARPLPTRGSADVVAFAKANALLILPEDVDRLDAGASVRVQLLDNFAFKSNRWPRAERHEKN